MTIGNPKLSDAILAQIISNILSGDNTDKVVKEAANLIDKNLDERFMSLSENLQEKIVRTILLPLCRELMKEDIGYYKTILYEEWQNIKIPIQIPQ